MIHYDSLWCTSNSQSEVKPLQPGVQPKILHSSFVVLLDMGQTYWWPNAQFCRFLFDPYPQRETEWAVSQTLHESFSQLSIFRYALGCSEHGDDFTEHHDSEPNRASRACLHSSYWAKRFRRNYRSDFLVLTIPQIIQPACALSKSQAWTIRLECLQSIFRQERK